MEYNSLFKWGVTFETIGFGMASFLLALLHEEFFKNIADKIKGIIKGIGNSFKSNFDSQSIREVLVLLFYLMWTKHGVEDNAEEWIKKILPIVIRWKSPLKYIPLFIIQYTYNIFVIILIIIVLAIVHVILLLIIWPSKLLSKENIITKILLIGGVCIGLIGLIIQTYHVWSS